MNILLGKGIKKIYKIIFSKISSRPQGFQKIHIAMEIFSHLNICMEVSLICKNFCSLGAKAKSLLPLTHGYFREVIWADNVPVDQVPMSQELKIYNQRLLWNIKITMHAKTFAKQKPVKFFTKRLIIKNFGDFCKNSAI